MKLRRRRYAGPDADLIRGVRPWHVHARARLRRIGWRAVGVAFLDGAGLAGLAWFGWLVWPPAAVLVLALSCLAIAWVIDR